MSLLPAAVSREALEQAAGDLHSWRVTAGRLTERYALAKVRADAKPQHPGYAKACQIAWCDLLHAVEKWEQAKALLADLQKLSLLQE